MSAPQELVLGLVAERSPDYVYKLEIVCWAPIRYLCLLIDDIPLIRGTFRSVRNWLFTSENAVRSEKIDILFTELSGT